MRVLDRGVHILGGVVACWLLGSSGMAGAETIDLATAFSTATAHAETRRADLGTPNGRRVLLSGFYADAAVPDPTFVWSRGPSSSLLLMFADRRPRRIEIRCWPLDYPDAPPRGLRFFLNSVPLGKVSLTRGAQTVQVDIPVGPQRLGANRLEVRYSDVQQPARVLPASTDERKLALAWDWIRISGKESSGSLAQDVPFVDREDGRERIVLPSGSLVAYYVRLRPGAALRVASLQPFDAAGAPSADALTLAVHVETDEDGVVLDTVLRGADTSEPIALPVPGERIARVALGFGGGLEPGRLAIEGARLEIPNSDPVPEGAKGETPDTRGEASADAAADLSLDELRSNGANVVLYVIDTLRADLLGAYGQELPVSPHFDRLAGEGVLFENAQAVSSWTRPTVVSILTGLRPTRHGVVGRGDRLADEAHTLAEGLRHAGYRTGGFITNANVGAEFGVDQGFDVYEWYPYGKDRPNEGPRSSVEATDSALDWIGTSGEEAPFFAYLHVSDPHGPYMPPELERERFAAHVKEGEIGTGPYMRKLAALSMPVTEAMQQDLTALYLGEIAYVDALLGEFLAGLDALGHRQDTLVVVVADHGEEFFEHGWSEHGKTLYAEQIHVPLVMRLPGGRLAGQRVDAAVAQVDLMPTILDLLSLDEAEWVDGRSLLTLLSNRNATPPVGIFATLAIDGRQVRSVTDGNLKLIETFEYAHPKDHHPGLQLFDLSNDPGEQRNLAAERPVAIGYLRSKGRGERKRAREALQPETAVLDAEVEEELRALGYLE